MPFSNTTNEAPKSEGSLFAAPAEPAKVFSNLFGGQTTIQPISSAQSAFSFVPKSTETSTVTSFSSQPSQASIFGGAQISKPQIPPVSSVPQKSISIQPTAVDPTPKSESNQPFITVAPTFSQAPQSNVKEKGTR